MSAPSRSECSRTTPRPSVGGCDAAFLRHVRPGLWRLEVWVQPGAGRTELAGEYQGRLKIRVAAPANDNKANEALVAFLAKLCGLRRTGVELVAGHANRKKTLHLALPEGNPPEVLCRGC